MFVKLFIILWELIAYFTNSSLQNEDCVDKIIRMKYIFYSMISALAFTE